MRSKRLIAGLAALCIGITATGLAACGPDTPEATEGTIYQTGVETFWVGIGKAYMTFEYTDGQYVFNVNVDAGDGYSSWLSGSWELEYEDNVYGDLTLTAEWQEGDNSTYLADATSGAPKTYTLSNSKYTIGVVLPSAGTINFTLDPVADKVGDGEVAEPETPETPETPEEGGEDEGGTEEEKQVLYTLTGTAEGLNGKIELYSDNSWELSISYYAGGAYMHVASGRWTQNNTDWSISLIVETDEADALPQDTYVLNVDYTTFEYSGTITVTIPSFGEYTFNFGTGTGEEAHYTVTYDLNYEGASGAPEAAMTSTYSATGEEYIASAPTEPVREGYKFAGWYTVADPVLENGAADTEYLFGTKLSAYNSAPADVQNGVMAITSDTTLYARWVQAVEIDSAEDLKAMAEDLSGWYVLTADITLTGEWTPIGGYYYAYEFYEPAWWQYAFRGELDGNGHTIYGLNMTTLAHADDAVSATEGSKAGTAGLFASAVNCYVHDLTISGAQIDITYSGGNHAYVSVLAGFVQGSATNFENCTVIGADIDVTVSDIWYVAVAGLFGGHWGGYATDCEVLNSDIDVVINNSTLSGYTYEAVYVGSLVGEGYTHVINCKGQADISLTYNDARTSGFSAQGAQIYLGGATASSTYLTGVEFGGNISLNFTSAGSAQVYVGGVSGYQRYGHIKNCLADADINVANAVSGEGKTFAAGGILGAFDCTYGLMGTAYFQIDACRVTNCIDMSSLKVAGEGAALDIVGSVPLDAVTAATAPAFGVDLTKYTNEDGTYNFFGAFNCVKVREQAAAADSNGNVTVADESAIYGSAMEDVLGDGWSYSAGSLHTPKAQ